MKEEIIEIKKKRFEFLHYLHQITGGSQFESYNMYDLGKELRFDNVLTNEIVNYLIGEGLIEFYTTGGAIKITHKGICEIEEAILEPDKPTEYFPPYNIIIVGEMKNSQIQQASEGTILKIDIKEDKYNEILELIELLKDNFEKIGINDECKSELDAEIKTIEAQLNSSKPKGNILKQCLDTIKSILESAAGSAISSTALNLIHKIISG